MNVGLNCFTNWGNYTNKRKSNNNINFGKMQQCADTFEKQNQSFAYKRIKDRNERILRQTQLYNRETNEYENVFITKHRHGPIFI